MDVVHVFLAMSAYFFIYGYYRQWRKGKYFSIAHRADGKTVIITDAISDTGKEIAMELCKRGATVIMACRDIKLGEKIRSIIIGKTKNSNVIVRHLDLTSFKSIRNFAKNILQDEGRLDILINNASVMGVDRSFTEDGIEMHMGVNHFGHFLLTLLLVDRLKESAPSRIVNVSHSGHKLVRLNKENVNSEKSYNRFHAFLQSKLANVIFTKELASRLAGSGITTNTLHPGLFHGGRTYEAGSVVSAWCGHICDILSVIFLQNGKVGAQNILCAALDFNLQNVMGAYLNNFRLSEPSKEANDPDLKSWLWEYSEKVTGVQLPKNRWKLDEYNLNVHKKAMLNSK